MGKFVDVYLDRIDEYSTSKGYSVKLTSIAPAPPWGERRGDGDHYAPVPYVDPGGQQPEVIGALCGRGLNDLKRIVSVTFVF